MASFIRLYVLLCIFVTGSKERVTFMERPGTCSSISVYSELKDVELSACKQRCENDRSCKAFLYLTRAKTCKFLTQSCSTTQLESNSAVFDKLVGNECPSHIRGFFGYLCKHRCNCRNNKPCGLISGLCPAGSCPLNGVAGCIEYGDTQSDRVETACQGKWLRIVCPKFTKISIIEGFYGRANKKTCKNRAWFPKANCKMVVSGKLQMLCNGEVSCEMRVTDSTMGGNPCHDRTEYASAKFRCKCPSGKFGRYCLADCHCDNDDVCDPVSGECPGRCAFGFIGDSCQDCLPSYWGVFCDKPCSCTSNSEDNLCERYSGRCISACDPENIDLDCLSQIPKLINGPHLVSRDNTSLTIAWDNFTEGDVRCCLGKGTIKGYIIIYRSGEVPEDSAGGGTKWKQVTMNRFHNEAIIDGLETGGGRYEVAVRIVSEKSLLGQASPIATFSTCRAPLIPLNVELTNFDKLFDAQQNLYYIAKVYWQRPSEREIGCAYIMKYQLTVQMKIPGENRGTNQTILSTTVSIDGTRGSYDVKVEPNRDYFLSFVYITNSRSFSPPAYLNFTSPPGVPSEVRSVTLGVVLDDSIQLSWTAPLEPNGSPDELEYVVAYKLTLYLACIEYGAWEEAPRKEIVTKHTNIVIDELKAFAIYNVEILARTSGGSGPTTPLNDIQTQVGDTWASIHELVKTNRSSSHILVEWRPPECVDWNGPFDYYLGELRRAHDDRLLVTKRVTTTKVNFINLLPFSEYYVTVKFANKRYLSSKSLTLSVLTLQGKAQAPTIKFRELTRRKQCLEWTMTGPQRGIITKYQLQLFNKSAIYNSSSRPASIIQRVPLFDEEINEQKSYYVFTDLISQVRYWIRLRAFTEIGGGPWSELEFVVPDECPSAPANFRNVSRSSSTIEFMWQKPTNIDHHDLLQYSLTCLDRYQRRGGSESQHRPLQGHEVAFTLEKLNPKTLYTCSIYAEAQGCSRRGSTAVIKVYTTLPKVTEPPSILGRLEVDQATATVKVPVFQLPSYFDDKPDLDENNFLEVVVKKLFSWQTRKRRSAELGPPPPPPPSGELDTSGKLDTRFLFDANTASQRNIDYYIVCRIYDQSEKSIIVGDNTSSCHGYVNPPLARSTVYEIFVGYVQVFDGYMARTYISKTVSIPKKAHYSDSHVDEVNKKNENLLAFSLWVVIVLVICAVAFIVIIIATIIGFIRRRRSHNVKKAERQQQQRTSSSRRSRGGSKEHKSRRRGEDREEIPVPIPRLLSTRGPPFSTHPCLQQSETVRDNSSFGINTSQQPLCMSVSGATGGDDASYMNSTDMSGLHVDMSQFEGGREAEGVSGETLQRRQGSRCGIVNQAYDEIEPLPEYEPRYSLCPSHAQVPLQTRRLHLHHPQQQQHQQEQQPLPSSPPKYTSCSGGESDNERYFSPQGKLVAKPPPPPLMLTIPDKINNKIIAERKIARQQQQQLQFAALEIARNDDKESQGAAGPSRVQETSYIYRQQPPSQPPPPPPQRAANNNNTSLQTTSAICTTTRGNNSTSSSSSSSSSASSMELTNICQQWRPKITSTFPDEEKEPGEHVSSESAGSSGNVNGGASAAVAPEANDTDDTLTPPNDSGGSIENPGSSAEKARGSGDIWPPQSSTSTHRELSLEVQDCNNVSAPSDDSTPAVASTADTSLSRSQTETSERISVDLTTSL